MSSSENVPVLQHNNFYRPIFAVFVVLLCLTHRPSVKWSVFI